MIGRDEVSVLVAGGAGFIGANFARRLLADGFAVTNVDAMTYAGVEATIDELRAMGGHRFIRGDIRDAELVESLVPGHDIVVNFAAESHVDRSIDGPQPFLTTNVVGTGMLLDAARRHRVRTFVQVSTDEVYGSIPEGAASEDAHLRPSSPYAASKAAADLLVRSYAATYGYEAIITRCTNNYGPFQFPEKLIPRFVTNLMEGRRVPLYGDGSNERDWLHVEDHCSAILTLIEHGEPGIWNIGADSQVSNLELTRRLLALLDLSESMIEWVEDRPGHDYRYAVDSSKLRALGWSPQHSLEDRLGETVEWYRSREDWWRPLLERVR